MQVDIWNSLAGVIPVRKFTDRNKAIARICKAIQSLVPASAPLPAPTSATVKPRKGKKAKSTDKPATARDGSKKARILDLLRQPDGATLAELMAATEWQAHSVAHSVRGFVVGTLGKKMSLTVESAKRDKDRVYSIGRSTLKWRDRSVTSLLLVGDQIPDARAARLETSINETS